MAMKKEYLSVDGEIFGEVSGGVVNFYDRDALGSVVAIEDGAGNTVSTIEYKPFGDVRTYTGENPLSSPRRFLWCGTHGYRFNERYAQYTSHYVRARHYSSLQGKWSTVDPLYPTERAYGYVENKVTTIIDFDGTKPEKLPPLSSCKSRRPKPACFACAYKIFQKGSSKLCPKQACNAANVTCGTHIVCGPCGPCANPNIPSTCISLDKVDELGEYLRGSNASSDGPFDCSKSCGGYGVGDKIAHCFKGCFISICEPVHYPIIACWRAGIFKDDEFEDADAEETGIRIGEKLRYNPLTAGSSRQNLLTKCLDKCSDNGSFECY